MTFAASGSAQPHERCASFDAWTNDLEPEELRAVGRKSNAVAEMPDVGWNPVRHPARGGTISWEYDAPSVEALLEHARRTGIPAKRIREVSLEIAPVMFA